MWNNIFSFHDLFARIRIDECGTQINEDIQSKADVNGVVEVIDSSQVDEAAVLIFFKCLLIGQPTAIVDRKDHNKVIPVLSHWVRVLENTLPPQFRLLVLDFLFHAKFKILLLI